MSSLAQCISLYALPQIAYIVVTELCIVNMIDNCFFLLNEQIKNFICVNLCHVFCVCHLMPKSGVSVKLSNIRKKLFFFSLLIEKNTEK